MGFNITFYKFNKEGNSTKRPSSSGTTYNCRILRGSSIVSPTIELSIGTTTAPDFNYAYIPNFNRYYYVSEWTYNDALWTASLEVDALATYRTEIGSENLYALRTSNSSLYDGRVVDTLYPTKAGCTYQNVNIDPIWNYSSTGYGFYILGVTSNNADFGAIKYYAVSSNRMELISDYLLSDTLLTDYNFDPNDASLELQKSIIDPIQFIKSCIYLPCFYADLTDIMGGPEDIYIFNWSMKDRVGNIMHDYYVLPDAPSYKYIRTVNIPKHPQTNSRGAFVNQSPYTILTLLVAPFGLIEIDTSVTSNATELLLEIEIDMPTGLGILTVSCNGNTLNRIEAQIGVPIQLSQVTRDYIGGVTSIVNGISSGIGSAISGNIGGAITGAIGSIGNAINSLAPRSNSIGSGGSFAQLDYPPKLQAQFFECVDDDIAKNGRPCCKVVNCSSGGYFLIQDGDVSISGTKAEWEMIKSQLEEGFYWE